MTAETRPARDQRIQDAIHGIIDFHPDSRPDRAAWRLLQTPDFQRLRRIKQLGTSEFVFPSASHSRLAHSIGVFHSARRLVRRIRRETTDGGFDAGRAETAILAALLHDLGHGPFSHVFERARQAVARRRGQPPPKSHEDWSAAMIQDADMRAILEEEGFAAENIAAIVCQKPPADMYHAIVSGTFDADRMDYMMRDKYMTGIGEGGFDTNWIMDNVRVAQRNGEHVFCLAHKALTAAEEFLLARYHLHKDIYLHKTSRAMECLLQAFFVGVVQEADERGGVAGLDAKHPLLRFFGAEENLDASRGLDDTAVWSAQDAVATRPAAAGASDRGADIADIAGRILERRIPHCLDVTHRREDFKQALRARLAAQIDKTVFFDSCSPSLYNPVGDDAARRHESLLVQRPGGGLREISELPESILARRPPPLRLQRCYFLKEEEYAAACRLDA